MFKAKNAERRRVLITAGPTRAYLDEVRYLSNFSTGATGYCIAKTLQGRGASIKVITGPTSQPWNQLSKVSVEEIETVAQMQEHVLNACKVFKPEVIIFAAAVLDFEPSNREKGKISSLGGWNIYLKPTPKIVDLVQEQFPHIKRIGFKLEVESENKEEKARCLLEEKDYDSICLNDLKDIQGDKHLAFLLSKNGDAFYAKNKTEIAHWITDRIFFKNESYRELEDPVS